MLGWGRGGRSRKGVRGVDHRSLLEEWPRLGPGPSPRGQRGGREATDLSPLPCRVPGDACFPLKSSQSCAARTAHWAGGRCTAFFRVLLLEERQAGAWDRPVGGPHFTGTSRAHALRPEHRSSLGFPVREKSCSATSPRATPSRGPPPPGARLALSLLRGAQRAEAQEGGPQSLAAAAPQGDPVSGHCTPTRQRTWLREPGDPSWAARVSAPTRPVQDSPALDPRRCPSIFSGRKLRPERPGPA